MGIKILYYSMVVTDNRFNFVIRQFSGSTQVVNQLLPGLCRNQLRSHYQMRLYPHHVQRVACHKEILEIG